MHIYHLHPAIVHFPIAFLVAAACVQLLDVAQPRHQGLAEAATWLLWIGTAMLWMAAGFGLLAERTAPHVPPAWEVLHEHRTLGLWTAATFTVLSFGRFVLRQRLGKVQLVLALLAVALLLSTAYHGGELVYRFGMGVAGG